MDTASVTKLRPRASWGHLKEEEGAADDYAKRAKPENAWDVKGDECWAKWLEDKKFSLDGWGTEEEQPRRRKRLVKKLKKKKRADVKTKVASSSRGDRGDGKANEICGDGAREGEVKVPGLHEERWASACSDAPVEGKLEGTHGPMLEDSKAETTQGKDERHREEVNQGAASNDDQSIVDAKHGKAASSGTWVDAEVYPLHLQMQELDHLVTDGCFVLARGSLQDGHFVVDALDTPKAMRREETLVKDLLPRQCFGGSLSNERLEILESYEAHKPDGFFVILSEVCLDNDRVIDKLTDLFQGYEESQPPCAYVIMGSFCSTPFVATGDGIKSYRDSFWQLKHLLLPLSNHVRCGTRFILLPGPNDPGAQTLPQAPLPPYLTADLAQEVPNVVFATNPCRIRHFSREMVFCRHDVMRHLRRHEVLPLRETDGGPASAAHSRNESVQLIFDQAHLVPLPLEHSSILWAYDHSLRLYPLPHAVFIGGVTPPFEVGYEGARFCSVGPFCRQAEFFAYHPIKDLMEPCGVHDRAG
eukprot:CAMPEP_0206420002 /NCGR_PEP_ID=MMETSP0324_2-20121206/538_1 /ASSEMBLY_ACC=CAM_ASM_000836 /TAXON_ID=2866 /ORGANISM="Crypthecodinium cohnii, Strain Seligo" /LENGTH=529 /DNA_ID=CAMNT_0053883713 /DNA_START=150 /DNA_END=1739 /DNA_ORIENTATION=-